MPMTVAVTRNIPDRFRGFLASCMLDVAPGVYVGPRMSRAVRQRVWNVLLAWAGALPPDGGIALLWRDREAPSGLSIRTLGWPTRDILEYEGMWLARGNLTREHDAGELGRLAQEGTPPSQ